MRVKYDIYEIFDIYDIYEIWHMICINMSIWVSKEALGVQGCIKHRHNPLIGHGPFQDHLRILIGTFLVLSHQVFLKLNLTKRE